MSIVTDQTTKRCWKKHQADYLGCRLCPLHINTFSYVLGKGTLPCEVLFIGDSPSAEDDTVGKPLVGNQGRILDSLIRESQDFVYNAYTFAVTNLVACHNTLTADISDLAGGIVDDALSMCRPRLDDFVLLADPKVIVFLGNNTRLRYRDTYRESESVKLPSAWIFHPRFLDKYGGVKSIHYRNALSTLQTFLADHL